MLTACRPIENHCKVLKVETVNLKNKISLEFSQELPGKDCFTIRVHLQKIHSSPVLTVEAYFDFKVLLPKH